MKLCVYGASSNAIDPKYLEAGRELGKILAQRLHRLIYGGGNTGMMGAVADGAAEFGGDIIGVAPTFFESWGVLRTEGVRMVFTETMRERKAYMEDHADAFIVTPGGIGTFEEFFETLTLKQLGRLFKPIIILNTDGYYDSLLDLLENTVKNGFLEAAALGGVLVARTPEEAVDLAEREARRHLCPVCGGFAFSRRGSYEICPVCGWEDDRLQEQDPDFAGGANKLGLTEARDVYYQMRRKERDGKQE